MSEKTPPPDFVAIDTTDTWTVIDPDTAAITAADTWSVTTVEAGAVVVPVTASDTWRARLSRARAYIRGGTLRWVWRRLKPRRWDWSDADYDRELLAARGKKKELIRRLNTNHSQLWRYETDRKQREGAPRP